MKLKRIGQELLIPQGSFRFIMQSLFFSFDPDDRKADIIQVTVDCDQTEIRSGLPLIFDKELGFRIEGNRRNLAVLSKKAAAAGNAKPLLPEAAVYNLTILCMIHVPADRRNISRIILQVRFDSALLKN